ncbi:L-rhamnose mutarotase [Faecalicatena contorta]|uniref:L-rhamnose mutarotase n=1 Tax=Faecalicatena contorta TaxID=39482 RepID=A0A315ZTT6_9FIRM|nr:L-rhamnose mutarotase [Faecalicatena contorta]PWJ48955.1 L-rhamnose mutarotase [Faecalicatena contorta]SUQ15045.1 L-rhamnose mutarotase [Faecalicatena contorta]
MTKCCFGQIGRLKAEKIQEYKELHAAVWPDVLKKIKDCCLENYSIFIKEDLVFAYFEYTGNNYEMDMRRMAEDVMTQKWWKLTKPCFTKLNVNSNEPFYENMESIFHLA